MLLTKRKIVCALTNDEMLLKKLETCLCSTYYS